MGEVLITSPLRMLLLWAFVTLPALQCSSDSRCLATPTGVPFRLGTMHFCTGGVATAADTACKVAAVELFDPTGSTNPAATATEAWLVKVPAEAGVTIEIHGAALCGAEPVSVHVTCWPLVEQVPLAATAVVIDSPAGTLSVNEIGVSADPLLVTVNESSVNDPAVVGTARLR